MPLRPVSPFAREGRLSRVEAVLFLANEPLSSRKLSQFASLTDGTEGRTLVRRLNQWYDASGSAFRVEEVAGGFQLMTRPKFGGWLRRLYAAPVETRLSGPALETLAVVAYRQPVLRAEIEAIRGVQCGEMLRQLMERDLARIVGRAEDLGRPFLYGTTKRFLQIFGLRHLDELPRAESLRRGALPSMSEPPKTHPGKDREEELTQLGDSKEESAMKLADSDLETEGLNRAETDGAELTFEDGSPRRNRRPTPVRAADEDEFEELDDEEDEDDDLDDDEDDELDDDDDEFEDDEWEEVDDDEDDEDWEDEDDDWDDDEDDDEDEDEEEENWADEE